MMIIGIMTAIVDFPTSAASVTDAVTGCVDAAVTTSQGHQKCDDYEFVKSYAQQ